MKSTTSLSAAISKQCLSFFGIIYVLAISWTTLSCLSQLYRFKMANSIDIFPQKDVLPDTQVKKIIKEFHL